MAIINWMRQSIRLIDGRPDGADPQSSSIAKRMSWASDRVTTRVGDMAYCLMGLFGVNMPLLYGERHRAFLRLQEKIMKLSEDQSLFAWRAPVLQRNSLDDDVHSGLLASSPAHFRKSKDIIPFHQQHDPYFMTNRGISISVPMLPLKELFWSYSSRMPMFLATLGCKDISDTRGPLCIFLVRNERGYYRRARPHQLTTAAACRSEATDSLLTQAIYVEQYYTSPRARANSTYQFQVPKLPEELLQHDLMVRVFPNERIASWDPMTSIIRCSRGLVATIYIGHADGRGLVLLLGIDSRLRARCAFDDGSDALPFSFDFRNWSDVELYNGYESGEVGSTPENELALAEILLRYRSDVAGVPGNFERLNDIMIARSLLDPGSDLAGSKISDHMREWKEKVEQERKRDWNEWISSPQARTTNLDLGSWATSKTAKSKFPWSNANKVWNALEVKIGASIHNCIVDGRTNFLVAFYKEI